MRDDFPIGLADRSDLPSLAAEFADNGVVQIRDFLTPESALSLHQHLRARSDWMQVLLSETGIVELPRDLRASMPEAQRQALDEAVYARARAGFQYRYESLRVPDGKEERRQSADPLARLAELMSGEEVRTLLRQVTGDPSIDFADAQGTAFSPGDFLTAHDDAVEGKGRRAAYVLNLTPTWRVEWGGLLLFHGADGHVSRGLVPSFNVLNVFRVPILHSVSEVTRASPYRRYSVTGWLRSGPQP